jgi:hypothetical protein
MRMKIIISEKRRGGAWGRGYLQSILTTANCLAVKGRKGQVLNGSLIPGPAL